MQENAQCGNLSKARPWDWASRGALTKAYPAGLIVVTVRLFESQATSGQAAKEFDVPYPSISPMRLSLARFRDVQRYEES